MNLGEFLDQIGDIPVEENVEMKFHIKCDGVFNVGGVRVYDDELIVELSRVEPRDG